MNRRGFLSLLGAAASFDPERLLWVPGAKHISIPRVRSIEDEVDDWRFIEVGFSIPMDYDDALAAEYPTTAPVLHKRRLLTLREIAPDYVECRLKHPALASGDALYVGETVGIPRKVPEQVHTVLVGSQFDEPIQKKLFGLPFDFYVRVQ